MNISTRAAKFPASATRRLIPYALEAKAKGRKVYHLNIGDPDIKTPEVMINVLKNWDMNPIRYGRSQGEEKFVQALKWYYKELGYDFLNDENIIGTIGGSEAILMSFFALTDPGDEIIVFEPYFTNYTGCADFAGSKLVAVPTVIGNGFHLPKKEVIESFITPRTKAMFYTNPNNPTGTVYTKEEVEMLVEIAGERGLFLISDEVYREFLFVDRPFISIMDYMKKMPEQMILVDSLSKRYSLCGARLGNIVSMNQDFLKSVGNVALSRLSGGVVDQMVGAELVNVDKEHFIKLNGEYRSRRDVVYGGLKDVPGVSLAEPEGAFYCMVKLPVKSAEEFAIWLLTDFELNNETVMFAPGSGFYKTEGKGKDEIRIAYVLNTEDLAKAVEILKAGLKKFLEINR